MKIWNPEKDKLIPKKYSAKKPEGKAVNRQALITKFHLDADENTPIIGNISRLYDTKGFDLIKKAFKQLMKLDMRLIILGTGDRKYHEFLEDMAFQYKEKFVFYPGFDDALAHLIEAGSDIYLMPSKTEPCGLNQMYSIVYGTVPVVHATGGLKDTVEPYDPKTGEGTGFLFENYTTKDLIETLKNAISLFKEDKKAWRKLVVNGMKKDFSWQSSAKNYVELYKKIIS
jgi:starch synthase